MNSKYIVGVGMVVVVLATFFWFHNKPFQCCSMQHAMPNVEKIEKILNTKADIFNDEKVVKVSFPRNDLKVTIKQWPLHPFMGLTSWVAFQNGTKKGIEVMAMGDLVLLGDEVNPAMSVALENNIEITALHNHFFNDAPKVYFMHINAEGSTEAVASGIHKIFETIKTVQSELAKTLPDHSNIDGALIEDILGVKGQAKDGMFKIVIGRKTKAGCGCLVGKNMGINTWAAFGGTNDNALVDGDFVVLESELQGVLKALRTNTINVVAIHNHMINENPRLIFLHFWGQGSVKDLAQGLKAALDKTGTLQ